MSLAVKKLLVSTHTYPNYMPVPAYSDQMVVVGPRYGSKNRDNGEIESINVPADQPYDLSRVIQSLPASQVPDVIFVRVDASNSNMPVGMDRIDIPKVLIIGDTHHLEHPLRNMLQCARSQKFDHYVLDHTRQHAHWFVKAGIHNLSWIPGFLLPDLALTPRQNVDLGVSFVGSVGREHIWRTHLLNSLDLAGVDVNVTSAEPEKAYSIYNRSLVTLNTSLNGDFNLRNFEVLQSGGLLLTDRLTQYAGMDEIFEEDKHYFAYSDARELSSQIRVLRSDPEKMFLIKQKAHRFVSEHHSLEARSRRFDALIAGAQPDSRWQVRDPRLNHYGVDSRDDFLFKMTVYEYLQEHHRVTMEPSIVFSPEADHRIAADLLDLPRYRIALAGDERATAMFSQLPAGDSVQKIEAAGTWQESQGGILALTSKEADNLDDWSGQTLLFTDWLRMSNPDRQELVSRLFDSLGLRFLSAGIFGVPEVDPDSLDDPTIRFEDG